MNEFLMKIEKIRITEVEEFYNRKDEIKEIYQNFDYATKEIYKWYYYFQFCLLKNPLKELLWQYISLEELDAFEKVKLSNEYFDFCRKKKKLIERQSQIDNF